VQPAIKVPRVGLLAIPSFESAEMQALLGAFRSGLRERGYVEGQNIVIEYRSAGGKFEQLSELASELVRPKVDVIGVGTTEIARVVHQATTTIPIVVALMVEGQVSAIEPPLSGSERLTVNDRTGPSMHSEADLRYVTSSILELLLQCPARVRL